MKKELLPVTITVENSKIYFLSEKGVDFTVIKETNKEIDNG